MTAISAPRFGSAVRLLAALTAAWAAGCTPLPPAPDWAREDVARLQRYEVDGDFEAVPVHQAFDRINRTCKANMVLDPRFYPPGGEAGAAPADPSTGAGQALPGPVSLKLGRVSGWEALAALNRELKLEGRWFAGAYYVTTPARLAEVAARAAALAEHIERLQAAYDRLQDWERHVLDALAERTDLENKWDVDIAAIVEGARVQSRILLWLDPRMYADLTPAEQAVNLSVRKVATRDVVTLVMAARGLDFTFAAGGIYIARPEHLARIAAAGLLAEQVALLTHAERKVREEADFNLENFTKRELDIEELSGTRTPAEIQEDWRRWLGAEGDAKIAHPATRLPE